MTALSSAHSQSNSNRGAAADLKTRIRIKDKYRTHPQNWYRWVFEHLSLAPMKRVLELGCGTCDLWKVDMWRVPEGLEAILTDYSFDILAVGAGDLANAQFSFAAADAQRLPLSSHVFSVDVVIANGLLDLVPERDKVLEEIRRVLKPGGILYASTGGSDHLREIELLLRPFIPDVELGGRPEQFGLENGASILSPWFTEIQLYRYDNDLLFDRPEPIVDYVFSEPSVRAALDQEARQSFLEFVRGVLGRIGEMRVTSNKGLFKARKSN